MAALSTAFAGAVLLLAGESSSAPPSTVAVDASVDAVTGAAPTVRATSCVVEVKGEVKGRGPCSIEYVTYPPGDGGHPSREWTKVRISGREPTVLVELDFVDPRVGPQVIALDASVRASYGSARIERGGQEWEAHAHAESDFGVTLTSVKPTCNDGGALKCWEIHGRVRASVPSALLSQFASPLELSVIF